MAEEGAQTDTSVFPLQVFSKPAENRLDDLRQYADFLLGLQRRARFGVRGSVPQLRRCRNSRTAAAACASPGCGAWADARLADIQGLCILVAIGLSVVLEPMGRAPPPLEPHSWLAGRSRRRVATKIRILSVLVRLSGAKRPAAGTHLHHRRPSAPPGLPAFVTGAVTSSVPLFLLLFFLLLFFLRLLFFGNLAHCRHLTRGSCNSILILKKCLYPAQSFSFSEILKQDLRFLSF